MEGRALRAWLMARVLLGVAELRPPRCRRFRSLTLDIGRLGRVTIPSKRPKSNS